MISACDWHMSRRRMENDQGWMDWMTNFRKIKKTIFIYFYFFFGLLEAGKGQISNKNRGVYVRTTKKQFMIFYTPPKKIIIIIIQNTVVYDNKNRGLWKDMMGLSFYVTTRHYLCRKSKHSWTFFFFIVENYSFLFVCQPESWGQNFVRCQNLSDDM